MFHNYIGPGSCPCHQNVSPKKYTLPIEKGTENRPGNGKNGCKHRSVTSCSRLLPWPGYSRVEIWPLCDQPVMARHSLRCLHRFRHCFVAPRALGALLSLLVKHAFSFANNMVPMCKFFWELCRIPGRSHGLNWFKHTACVTDNRGEHTTCRIFIFFCPLCF